MIQSTIIIDNHPIPPFILLRLEKPEGEDPMRDVRPPVPPKRAINLGDIPYRCVDTVDEQIKSINR